MTSMKITLPLLFAITVLTITNLAAKTLNPPADPGWPRQRTSEQGRLVYYQPQVDAWTNFKELSFRMAFSLTPKGGKEIVGVVEVQAQTDVNMDDRSVLIRDFKIKEVKLPGLDPAKASQVDQAVRSFLPPGHTVVMALDRLVASVEKTQAPATVQVQNDPPKIFVSYTPAILLDIDGEPTRAEIADTNMGFVVNSNFPLFFEKGGANYLFTGEQWLKAPVLEGPWAPVANLPKDMTKVANDPQWAQMKKPILSPSAKGKPPTIFYSNKPAEVILFQGQPNEGTSMQYATNTADKVIKVGDVYYLCLQGVWFMSPSATGPWTTANSVPKEIYTIPASSPVYNVTYVTQSTTPEGTVQSSYTAGYLGTFITGAAVGAILASGTGYYYPPYYGYPVGGYPIYRPYAATYGVGSYYNTYSGAYGVARGVYGPYGGAAAGAAYNPYTGTYARGATAYGPYGSRSVAQAYNPYTGTYAATHQGSNAYSSWGQSVVSNGNKSAYTQHYSNANGTVGSIQGSQGGAAVGASTKYGDTAVAKTSSGNMYATHDGNVYKNTGNGWSSYDNGNWNSVNNSKNAQQQAQNYQKSGSSSNQASAQQRAQSSERSGQSAQSRSSGSSEVDREAQKRQRGASQGQRVSEAQRGGGGGEGFGGGGGERWGGGGRERSGGGRRR